MIASALCTAEMDEPKTMNQAKKRPDAQEWMKAAQEEMDSLLEHDTWTKSDWKQVGLQDQA